MGTGCGLTWKLAGLVWVRCGRIKGVVVAVDINFLIVADVCGIQGADVIVAVVILLGCHREGHSLVKFSTAFDRVWRNWRGAIRPCSEYRTWHEAPSLRLSIGLHFCHLQCYRLQYQPHDSTPQAVDEAVPKLPLVLHTTSVHWHIQNTQGYSRYTLQFLSTQSLEVIHTFSSNKRTATSC